MVEYGYKHGNKIEKYKQLLLVHDPMKKIWSKHLRSLGGKRFLRFLSPDDRQEPELADYSAILTLAFGAMKGHSTKENYLLDREGGYHEWRDPRGYRAT